jgi:hypothetical protein
MIFRHIECEKWITHGKFHFDGTNLMQQLLESEGIEVVDNQIMILIIILANHQ